MRSLTAVKSAIMKWSMVSPVNLLIVSTVHPGPAMLNAEFSWMAFWAGKICPVLASLQPGNGTIRSRGKLTMETRFRSAERFIRIITSEFP